MKRILCLLLICSICIMNGCAKSAKQYYDAAQKYLSAGEYDKAIENFQQALKIDAKNLDAYSGLAAAYQQAGRNDDYISILQQEIETVPNCGTDVYVTLADAYYKAGNSDKNTATVQAAAENIEKDDAQSFIDLANELLENGNNAGYFETLTAGYEKTNSSEIKELLAKGYPVTARDLSKVYNTLINSGKFEKYTDSYQRHSNQTGDYLIGASKSDSSLTIDFEEPLPSVVDGVFVKISRRFYIDKIIFNGKNSYEVSIIANFSNGESFSENKSKQISISYKVNSLGYGFDYLSFHEDDTLVSADTSISWNGCSFKFKDGVLINNNLGDSKISEILPKELLNYCIDYADKVLEPFGMSYDDVIDRGATYYYAAYDTYQ